jgi:hypothetical protein
LVSPQCSLLGRLSITAAGFKCRKHPSAFAAMTMIAAEDHCRSKPYTNSRLLSFHFGDEVLTFPCARAFSFSAAAHLERSDASLSVRSHPLPLTKNEAETIQTFLTVLAALFVLIPFCYLAATFAVFVVRETAVKAKHLQVSPGLRHSTL